MFQISYMISLAVYRENGRINLHVSDISYVISLAVYRKKCRVNLHISDILCDIVG